jgi:esterase/lipase
MVAQIYLTFKRNKMKVIFSHGKESGPWGSKIKLLADIAKQQGFAVDSIDYSGIAEPDLRVEKLLSLIENETDLILVGSSMGGYVSLVASASQSVKAVFLLAPALYIANYNIQEYSFSSVLTEVVHGWSDDIIPVDNSIRFCQQQSHSLHLIPGDHRLNSSIDTVATLFKQFLIKAKN